MAEIETLMELAKGVEGALPSRQSRQQGVTLPQVDEVEAEQIAEPLPEFPRLPGALGQLVDGITGDIPYDHKALAAITYMGIGLAGKVKLLGEPWLQPRFYSCLVGKAGGGKSAGEFEVRRALCHGEPVVLPHVFVEYSIDSGPALVQALEENRRIILAPDELADQFEKARATVGGRNSLTGELLRLYESNETGNHTKKVRGVGGNLMLSDAMFSLIGGVATERFESMWIGTNSQASGLKSRFVLSYSEKDIPRLRTPNNDELINDSLRKLASVVNGDIGLGELAEPQSVRQIRLNEEAQREIGSWRCFDDDGAEVMRRVLDMAKRFCLVVVACEGLNAIDGATMRMGLQFADYQIALREKLFALDASSYVQAFENRILKFCERHGQSSAPRVLNSIKPDRWPGGFASYNQAFAALIRAGKLQTVAKTRKGECVWALQ